MKDVKKLDLNLLRALDAMLKERNLTRAGLRLGMAQPRVTKALQKLRLFFEDDLLLRSGRDYELTPLGNELLIPVAEVLRLIESTLERRPSFDPQTEERRFRIAASEEAAIVVLRPFIRRLTKEAPGVTLQVHALDAEASIRLITQGQLDIGIWSDEVESELRQQELYYDRSVYAVWRDAEIRSDITAEELKDLPHFMEPLEIRHRLSPPYAPYIEANDQAAGANSAFLRLLYLAGSHAAVITQERFAKLLADFAELRLLDLEPVARPVSQTMFWHARNDKDPAHSWLRRALTDEAKQL